MQTLGWIALAVAIMAVVAWYLSYNAARLDRLHAKVEGSVSALDAQLVRRAEVSVELANSGLIDPASALLLAEAASESLDTSDAAAVRVEVSEQGVDAHRAKVETDLTHTLIAVLTPEVVETMRARDGYAVEQLDRVQAACQRVQLARRFYNDAVADVQNMRAQPLVRVFRLAGHTDLPQVLDFDDTVPQVAVPVPEA
ncbi:hypothetical protein [Branchiibius sp. NY16-3462-2]|uniref:hypothetical protein n=1 Tax=Branchiibius sp. NY16-3462-2 TaxID=1807500 RepID=UPI0007982E57|nr:hypothetical protein [Branchiibius sp. NY16-3462-2]KYH44724.1 hypothetical protein AZH51_03600 [Branchiibius sp. NY16-3462-2]